MGRERGEGEGGKGGRVSEGVEIEREGVEGGGNRGGRE